MEPQGDALRRVGWALRRYGVIAAALVILTMAFAGSVSLRRNQQPEYEATALVVATKIEISAAAIPRYAQAVFDSGAVASRVARDLDLERDFRLLIPDYIDMEPVQNSIAFLVRGYARQPEEAARRANSAATAFLDELNRAGPGIGTFTIQAFAQPPLPTNAWPSLPSALAIGAVAGTLFAAVYMIVLAARKPGVTALGDDGVVARA